ncbi:precorrin-6y C5,15-methyltransferase (decarboxylating) subunit CbiE [Clostridiaceae bacterium M8S5]|nr:precorrin-6y C5,15-methyltransferase (decarboxylating) subunit CbiE [Clostridiaceae bacterium M8S5]
MNKINVIGLGPGNKDYILPIALREIKNSHIVIGAKRNISSILDYVENKEIVYINSNLQEIIHLIHQRRTKKKISVIVSGDTGFYSLVRYMQKYFNNSDLNIITGISSMQYMFSRVGRTYERAKLISLHGRYIEFVQYIKEYEMTGVLTDKVWTPSAIATELLNNNISDCNMYIGENLSYDNEKIIELSLEEASKYKTENINIVIISNGSYCRGVDE